MYNRLTRQALGQRLPTVTAFGHRLGGDLRRPNTLTLTLRAPAEALPQGQVQALAELLILLAQLRHLRQELADQLLQAGDVLRQRRVNANGRVLHALRLRTHPGAVQPHRRTAARAERKTARLGGVPLAQRQQEPLSRRPGAGSV